MMTEEGCKLQADRSLAAILAAHIAGYSTAP